MQGATEFHHQITDAFHSQVDPVFDDGTALDTAVAMLNLQPVGERLTGSFLLLCQLLAVWFLGRHEDPHLGVSDCVEMNQNGQGENVAFFWHQICCESRRGDSQPIAIA